MKFLSIKSKLWLPTLAISVVLALLSGFTAWRGGHLQAQFAQDTQAQQRKLEIALQWSGLTQANATRVLSTLAGDATVAALFKPAIAATTKRINELQASLDELAGTDEEKAALAAVAQARKRYIAARDQAAALKQQGQAEQAMARLASDVQPAITAYLEVQQAFVALQRQRSQALSEAAEASMRMLAWTGSAVTALAIALMCVSSALLVRSLCRPLNALAAMATRIGQGDLTARADVGRRDEIGTLQQALDGMTQSLRHLVGQMRQSASDVSKASDEIAQGSADLSARTEHTAANLQQTAASLQQVTDALRAGAESAATASVCANSASEAAQRGGEVVARVVSTMDGIQSASHRIEDIIGTID
ncbi:methyl-accepting chemotaxis protein, partial [Azohydromonas lata]|uniref:methyl-accepting chemotaxis protein n=1 Tax=Azohydromonas lata TaxID=45677 RepID=UPI00082DB889